LLPHGRRRRSTGAVPLVVDLATHDVGGISEKDFELAAAMDKLA
jgi:pterin-4a-carbinolamine dehydratase